ncbi:unknown [Succinatimonas sp. CAG:777]|nr:unknown [Succinatimonas sp. CAG:777]
MFPGSLALIFKKDSNILMSKVLPKRLGLVKSKTVVPLIKDLSSTASSSENTVFKYGVLST